MHVVESYDPDRFRSRISLLSLVILLAASGGGSVGCTSGASDAPDALSADDVTSLRGVEQALTSTAESCYPTSASTLAHWPLDGASGPVTDSSGSGHDGTATNVTRGIAGQRGTAFDFDGATSNVDLGSGPTWAAGDAVSIAFWIDRHATGSAQTVLARVDAAPALTGWSVTLDVDYRVVLSYVADDAAGDKISVRSGAALIGAGWRHVAVVRDADLDGGDVHMYFDGEPVATEPPVGTLTGDPMSGAGSLVLGGATAVGGVLAASVDDVAVWSGALSPAEVAVLVNVAFDVDPNHCGSCGNVCGGDGVQCVSGACATTFCGSGVARAWTFDEGAGSTAAELAAFGGHATGVPGWTPSGMYGGAATIGTFGGAVVDLTWEPVDRDLAFTVSAWVKPHAGGSGWRRIIGRRDSDGAGWELALNGAGEPAFLLASSSSSIEVHANVALTVDAWSHVAATWSGASGAASEMAQTSTGLPSRRPRMRSRWANPSVVTRHWPSAVSRVPRV